MAVGANMWKIYCLITYICNEKFLKTSLTCVFLVKSKCDDTPISVLCNLLLSPTHHDAPAKTIMENLCSWLVSLLCCCPDPHEHNGHCVLPTLDALVVLAPSTSGHCFQTWWRGHFSCKPKKHGHNSHYDRGFVK